MKDTENFEQLLERFYKRTTQIEDKQKELEDAHLEYIKLDRDLDRLKGSIQAIEYCAYGICLLMVIMISLKIINLLDTTI